MINYGNYVHEVTIYILKKTKKLNKTQRKHAACQPAAMRVKTPYENPLIVTYKEFWDYFPVFLLLCRAILNFSPCSVRSVTRSGRGFPALAVVVASVFLDKVSFMEHREVLLTIQGLSSCSLSSSAARTYSAIITGS